MREFIDVTGKTEDEAISKALAQLGLDRDDVSVEILERAKSGFLGLGKMCIRDRLYTWESWALVLAATWLTLIFLRRSRKRSTCTRNVRSRAKTAASIRAVLSPKRIISRSVRARGDFPQER